jgi:hypothetical protein
MPNISIEDSHGAKDFSMRNRLHALAGALALCVLSPATSTAQSVIAPSNADSLPTQRFDEIRKPLSNGVLLPPQTIDESNKTLKNGDILLPPQIFNESNKLPPNDAVLLPPQTFDHAVKTPNTTRERYGQWSISGGVFLIQPVFETNPAFVVSGSGGAVARQVDFSHRLEVAPSVWLGYVSERGWGMRGRWFQFDHAAAASYGAAPGETITGISPLNVGRAPVNGAVAATSNLAVNVFDFQGTCTLESAKWSHLVAFGVRYTHMSQDYRATLSDVNTRLDLTSGHNFNGAGPSFALETKRRIGETHFSIYGQMQGAILFGHASEGWAAVNNTVPQQFAREETRVLPVGELEIGVEYQRHLGRADLFLQAGFLGQVWWAGGNASNVDALGVSSASNNNFGFVGLAVRAGLRY